MFEFATSLKSEVNEKFAEKRLLERYEYLMEMMADSQSCILNQMSRCRKERKAGYDFFKNERVSEEQLKAKIYEKLGCDELDLKADHVLVISDTTEYNYGSNAGQIRNKSGLGILGSEGTLGYLAHVSLALRASDLSVLGLSDLQLWHRQEDRSKADSRKQRRFEDKESYRWYVSMMNSDLRLASAGWLTYIQDREGDIFESIASIKRSKRTNLLIRSWHDRKIVLADGTQNTLYNHLAKESPKYSYELAVRGDKKKGRSSRIAQLEVYSSRVQIRCPMNLRGKKYDYPPVVEVDVIWVKENACSVPSGEPAIDWKLITTHRVAEDEKGIKQVIQWYTNRWLIEEFFLSPKQGPMTWSMPCWRAVMAYEN
jgi:hypothetical protein